MQNCIFKTKQNVNIFISLLYNIIYFIINIINIIN